MVMARLSLRVFDETLAVDAEIPNEPSRFDEMLPFMRALDNAVIGAAVRRTEAIGSKISCCKGCSTCCRAQPVPVTPVEAYALWRLVKEMPEQRSQAIKQRFADRVTQLRDAGLIDPFLRRDPDLTAKNAREVWWKVKSRDR